MAEDQPDAKRPRLTCTAALCDALHTILKSVHASMEIAEPACVLVADGLVSKLASIITAMDGSPDEDKVIAFVQESFPSEIGKCSAHEIRKALVSEGGKLCLQPAVMVDLLVTPCNTRTRIALAALLEYLAAELLELSGVAAQNANSEGVRTCDVRKAICDDEELRALWGDTIVAEDRGVAVQPTLPANGACIKWPNDEDFEDEFGTPTYLRWQCKGHEENGTASFPLERWCCGHWPKGSDHSNHNVERVREISTIASKLTALVSSANYIEVSDFDSEFTAFTALVFEGELPSREPAEIAKWLCGRLQLDAKYAKAHSLPIDDAHRDKMMHAYPREDNPMDEVISNEFHAKLTDCFHFRGAGDTGEELCNTYPVIFAGFTREGDVAGVFAIRCDT